MKTKVLLSLVVLLSFVACQKAAQILPNINQGTPTKTTPPPVVVTAKPDTMPEKAIFNIRLGKDSIQTDETAFLFRSSAKTAYDVNEDAAYFMGNGTVSLASLSSDGTDLAINNLPYTPGMSIGLDFNTKADGSYYLMLSYENKVPADIHIWLKDKYLKDSVDLHTKSYTFSVTRADTNSFGRNRFKLVLR